MSSLCQLRNESYVPHLLAFSANVKGRWRHCRTWSYLAVGLLSFVALIWRRWLSQRTKSWHESTLLLRPSCQWCTLLAIQALPIWSWSLLFDQTTEKSWQPKWFGKKADKESIIWQLLIREIQLWLPELSSPMRHHLSNRWGSGVNSWDTQPWILSKVSATQIQ